MIPRIAPKLLSKLRDTCLDHVYENMEKQIANFSSSVDAYNAKMKETAVQALELYEQRIDVEISTRKKVMEQKGSEFATLLEMSMQETEVDAANLRVRSETEKEVELKKLEVQKRKDQHENDKAMKELERAEKKAQQELDKQQKKDELDHKREVAKIERMMKTEEAKLQQMKKKDDIQHEKVMKDIEAKVKKDSITQAERDSIVKELQQEVLRYNKEFGLAETAMRDALARGKKCHIKSSAPKIDWSTPPRVVPGSVTWEAGSRW